MNIFDKIKAWWKKHNHKCLPIKYSTGETLIFHWDVPWMFSQEFTVCKKCDKVKVLSEVSDGCVLGGYKKEKDGEPWSGKCDFAKVPSIGRDKLTVSRR